MRLRRALANEAAVKIAGMLMITIMTLGGAVIITNAPADRAIAVSVLITASVLKLSDAILPAILPRPIITEPGTLPIVP